MAHGPGKYDDLATYVRQQAQAAGVVLMVIDGKLGVGFSVQGPLAVTVKLPAMLRDLATQIEADMQLPPGP